MTIEVIDMKLKNSGNLRAFCSVLVNGVTIRDVRVMDGKNGLFASLPSRQMPAFGDKPSKWVDVVLIEDREMRAEFSDTVVAHYQRVTGAPVEAPRETQDGSFDVPF